MTAQLERLNQDVIELDQYINTVKQRGQYSLVQKLKIKKTFLEDYISEVQQAS